MALTPPTPGLRRFVNRSRDVAKVALVVPAGNEVEVSDYVAAQLGSEFRELAPDEVWVHPALLAAEPEAEAPAVEAPAKPSKSTKKG